MLYKEAIPFLTTGRQGARSRGQADYLDEFEAQANKPVTLRDKEELVKGQEVIHRNTPDNSPSGVAGRYAGILAGGVTGSALGSFAGSRAFYRDNRSNIRWGVDTAKNILLADTDSIKKTYNKYQPLLTDLVRGEVPIEESLNKIRTNVLKSSVLARLNDPNFYTSEHLRSVGRGALRGVGKGMAISSIPTALWLGKNYLDNKYHYANMRNIHEKYNVPFTAEETLNTYF